MILFSDLSSFTVKLVGVKWLGIIDFCDIHIYLGMKNNEKKLISITIQYKDDNLQKITKTDEEIIRVPADLTSGGFINHFFERYPEIVKKYPYGLLGFELNGHIPRSEEILKDGDQYEFITWTTDEALKNDLNIIDAQKLRPYDKPLLNIPRTSHEKFPAWMDCAWRRVPCNKDSCRICGKINRDRKRHIAEGRDPDDLAVVFEDVGNNFKEALAMIKQDAEKHGIDITNIEDIQEPPEPNKFPLYKNAMRWREGIHKLAAGAEEANSVWPETEAGQDLIWYSNTLIAKTYRQLCNRWHLENGDNYGDYDYEYTSGVLRECLKIIKAAFATLSELSLEQSGGLAIASVYLAGLEKDILNI